MIKSLNALKGRHIGIHPLQLFQTLGGDFLTFPAAAAGTDITDDANVTTDGVTVNRMVDGTVAHAAVVHMADNGFKGFHIVGSVAVQFHIADVTGIAQSVVGAFRRILS